MKIMSNGEAIAALTFPELNILLKRHGIKFKGQTQDNNNKWQEILSKNKNHPIFKVWTAQNIAAQYNFKVETITINDTVLGRTRKITNKK